MFSSVLISVYKVIILQKVNMQIPDRNSYVNITFATRSGRPNQRRTRERLFDDTEAWCTLSLLHEQHGTMIG